MTVSAPERSTQVQRALRDWRSKLSATSRRLTPLSWSSVGIGLIAVAAVLASLISAPGLRGVLGAGLGLIMLRIAVIDGRHFIIPNPLTAAGFALALVDAAVAQSQATSPAPGLAIGWAIGLAIGRGVMLALFFLLMRHFYNAIRGREGLGLGDVKLAGVAGAWLDWLMLPIVVEIAALAALLVYLLRQGAFNRAVAATHRLPFGLFFAPAIWLCWVMQTLWLTG